jgi:hypothetical protein
MSRIEPGRVFFVPDKGKCLQRVKVLALHSHVENVVQLAQCWNPQEAYRLSPPEAESLADTHAQLVRAAQIHDAAKPCRFRLFFVVDERRAPEGEFTYSFAGHRFEVFDDDPYVQILVRLHHEYSVAGVTAAQARLRAQGLRTEAKALPRDLYTLEMCDQIGAEAETWALGQTAQPRVFMDFHSGKLSGDSTLVDPLRLRVDPYPFAVNEIRLDFEFAEFDVSSLAEQIAAATKEVKEGRRVRLGSLEDFLTKQMRDCQTETRRAVLCPWT